jgi:hypothetical protein
MKRNSRALRASTLSVQVGTHLDPATGGACSHPADQSQA